MLIFTIHRPVFEILCSDLSKFTNLLLYFAHWLDKQLHKSRIIKIMKEKLILTAIIHISTTTLSHFFRLLQHKKQKRHALLLTAKANFYEFIVLS